GCWEGRIVGSLPWRSPSSPSAVCSWSGASWPAWRAFSPPAERRKSGYGGHRYQGTIELACSHFYHPLHGSSQKLHFGVERTDRTGRGPKTCRFTRGPVTGTTRHSSASPRRRRCSVSTPTR